MTEQRKTLWKQSQDDATRAFEKDVVEGMGYQKVRVLVAPGKWAIRYLPSNYPLRVDEELCE